jgi:hypothetical protein
VCVCVRAHTRQDLYRFERFELISVEFKLRQIDNSFQNLDRLLWEIITDPDPLKFQENHQFQTKSNASDLPMEQCVSESRWFDKSTIRIWLPEANCQQRALCDMQLQLQMSVVNRWNTKTQNINEFYGHCKSLVVKDSLFLTVWLCNLRSPPRALASTSSSTALEARGPKRS